MSEISKEQNAGNIMLEQLKAMIQYGENKRITNGHYDKELAVRCINGTFVGKKTENIIAYKGIPFVGRQPVGDLRWKAPEDYVNDDGVYEAYYNGKSPFQTKDLDGLDLLYCQGEDCLYLDIWKADEAPAEKKPVIVWIHGGAYEAGGTAYPVFDCCNFIKENPDVIVVTVAYRLGVFGFFHLSHLADGKEYPDAQNLGLMDQIMALKWVHENIVGFGGDPDNVTIWGESAGAGSVSLLPLVKGSHAYFKRVIAQSGSPALTRTTEEAIGCTNEMMDLFGCKTVADLLQIDARKFVDASTVLSMRTAPERDGNYLPPDPWEAYVNGAAKDIAFLHGCNKGEFDYFASVMGEEGFELWAADRKAKKFARLTEEEKALAESFCKDVKGGSDERNRQLFNQIWFNAPLMRLSESQTKAGGRSYTYFFTAAPEHGVELTIVFNHPEMTDATEKVFDETFAKTMRKMWVQFAKTGNPSLSADISPDRKAKEWPIYDTADRKVMIFDEFDIHPEKESERKIVDWDRSYFLAKCYF